MKRLCLLLVLLALPLVWVGYPARAASSPPNIILIVTDDQTIGTLKAMPNVRALIKNGGTSYTSAYISNPICCPSRAAILTGLYSHSSMTYTNQDGGGARSEPWLRYGGAYGFHELGNNENRTLANLLHEQGYYTGLIGKYLNGYRRYADGFHGDGSQGSGAGWKPAGWDRWVSFYENNGEYLDYDLNVDGHITHFGSGPREHSTRVLGNRAVRFLRDRPDQPFFLYFAPFAPHGDFVPEKRDSDMFLSTKAFDSPAVGEDVSDKPTYIQARPDGKVQDALTRMKILQTLYGVDRQVGRIIDTLSPEDLANTIVVYMSDNGQSTGEHDWLYKLVPYERTIQVPLLMRWPGHVAAGTTDDSFVVNVDVFPTLLAAAGHAPVASDGIDILGPAERTEFLLEGMYYPRETQGSVPTYCGIVTRGWKYVVYSPTEEEGRLVVPPFEEELYNRQRDPWELENVAANRPAKVAEMRNALKTLCDPRPPDTTDAWWDAWAR